jgi:hypothetical protein
LSAFFGRTESVDRVKFVFQPYFGRAMANIHLIGGEKGGVGKSLVARILAQYFIDRSIPFIGFDSDRSHSALMRFYPDHASPVLIDRYESLDTIVETATENAERRILVDLAAQAQEALTKWMDESQLLEVAREIGLNIYYWHVMDSGKDSVDLLRRLFDQYEQRLNYVIVQNQLRGDDFGILNGSGLLERAQALNARVIAIKRLREATMAKIDAHSSSFWAATQADDQGGAHLRLLERQRFRTWLKSAYEAIDKVGV